jgi:hypothetical protein
MAEVGSGDGAHCAAAPLHRQGRGRSLPGPDAGHPLRSAGGRKCAAQVAAGCNFGCSSQRCHAVQQGPDKSIGPA